MGAGANAANVAAGSWETFYPVGQSLSLELPSTWDVGAPSQGVVFQASAPDGNTEVDLDIGSYSGTPAQYFAAQIAQAHQVYLAIDPRAIIQSKRLALPGGVALEVITHMVERYGGKAHPVARDEYDFIRSGKVYGFDYETTTREASTYFPVFEKSARTIHFK